MQSPHKTVVWRSFLASVLGNVNSIAAMLVRGRVVGTYILMFSSISDLLA